MMLDNTLPQTLHLTLYRIVVHPSLPLFPLDKSRDEIISIAIKQNQPLGGRRRTVWKIGNVASEECFLYLRFGRTRIDHKSILNNEGNFEDTINETAPYSHVFIDTKLSLCAISRNSDLAYNTDRIAEIFSSVLNRTLESMQIHADIVMESVKDPIEFLRKLHSSHQVSRLWVKVKLPNPIDTNRDFIQPVSRVLEALAGEESKTEWVGKSLNVRQDFITDIVNTAATTGGSAGAMVKKKPGSPFSPITLTSNAVRFGVVMNRTIRDIISEMREAYNAVRHRGQDLDQED